MQQLRDGLRQRAREYRRALTDDAHHKISTEICSSIRRWEGYQKADILLCYFPIGREIELQPLLKDALKNGKAVFLPHTNEDFSLSFQKISDLNCLKDGAMGTKEPSGGEEYSYKTGGLCIVPGLCFDKTGGRLGYGKGCYDRFLAGFSGVIAALCYDALVFDNVFPEPHDVPVDFIFTEKRNFYK